MNKPNKLILVCVLCIMLCGLCCVPASASVVIGEASETYSTLLHIESITFKGDNNPVFQATFAPGWDNIQVPNNNVIGSFVERQYTNYTNTSGFSIGGTMSGNIDAMDFTMNFNGEPNRIVLSGGDMVFRQDQFEALSSAVLFIDADSTDYTISFDIDYIVYSADGAKMFYEYPSHYERTAVTSPIEISLFSSSMGLRPVIGSVGDYAAYYYINNYSITIESNDGSLGAVEIGFRDMPMIKASERVSVADELKNFYNNNVVSPLPDLDEAWAMLIRPVESFFAIELAPHITIGGIFTALLATPFVIAFLKWFAGG